MKKTNTEIFVIGSRFQGLSVYSSRSRPRHYSNASPAKMIDAIRMVDPAEVRVEMSYACIPMASLVYYSEFASKLRLYGRHVEGQDAHRYNRMVGGLRKVEEADKVLFKLCEQLLDDQENKVVVETASRHPVWRYLTFPLGACLDAACAVMLKVVDPRSHIDPSRDSLTCEIGSLRKYLGIHRRKSDKSEISAKTVAAAWGRFYENDDSTIEGPNGFFRTMYRRLLVQGMTEEEAERRTSAKYVAYLQKSWLESIRTGGSEKFFDAQLLFGKADAVKSLQAHLDAVDSAKPLA